MNLNFKVLIKVCLPMVLCLSAFNVFGQNEANSNSSIITEREVPIDWRIMGGNKNATFYEVQDAFNEYWKNRTPSKGQGYSIFKRWEAQMLPRVYPSGDMSLPSYNYQNYMEWLRETGNNANERSATSNWTTLGPVIKPAGYDAGVGRVDFLTFDPLNSNTMYVGTPDGGLWKSTTGGTSWTTNTDFLGVIGCADLVIHPTTTSTMYLATGNWETDRSSIGVLKSTDGGATWNTTSLVWSPSDSYEIRRMAMDPNNPMIMMVVTDGGLFRTTDGWATHVEVSTLNSDNNLYDIQYKPQSSDIVYASGKSSVNTNVFWRSTDKGETWTPVLTGLPSSADVSRIIIGVTKHDANYVYLLAGSAANAYKGVYRSIDSGVSFSTQSTTPNILSSKFDASGTDGQANHDLAIAVSPINKDKVSIGGISQWRSVDGGVNWTQLSYWLGVDPAYPGQQETGVTVPYTHADIQAIEYLPGLTTDDDTFFTMADGGIYKTTNDASTYTDLSSGLSIAQQNVIAQSATTEGLLVTGLQDIGTLKKSGGTWSVIGGGDGEAAFIDRTSDNIIITSCPNGAHEISFDGGTNHTPITGLPAGLLFYCPISQDPTNVDVVYAGGRAALHKNVDFSNAPNTWVTLGTPPSAGSGASIIRFAVAPSDNTTIYVIKGNESDATTLSKSTDGGSTFTNITGTLPTSVQMTNLTVSNTDKNKIWVTYSGYESGNKVFRSINGGTSWENMSNGLPNVPMNTITHVNNSVNDELYLGGDIGIYYYDNTLNSFAPGNWTLFNTGLPNTKVTDLNIFYPTNKLRASTYGRGSWESPITSSVLPVDLAYFSGESRGEQNILNWTTDTEVNLDYYDVQRSKDGVNFENIGIVKPASPNSEESLDYQFVDKNPLIGKNYYRLQVKDLDGSYEFSNIVVLFQENKVNIITLSPNPTSGVIELTGLSYDNVTLRLFDANGKQLSVQKLSEAGQVNVSHLSNGTYFLEIKTGNKTIVKQFIKD